MIAAHLLFERLASAHRFSTALFLFPQSFS
jgi:hypothetical protein